jgi:hypothetical protein
MSKLQKKPSALKRGHPTLQNMNFYKFFSTFVGHFCPPGSPDPLTRLKPDPIRIRIRNPDCSYLVLLRLKFIHIWTRNCYFSYFDTGTGPFASSILLLHKIILYLSLVLDAWVSWDWPWKHLSDIFIAFPPRLELVPCQLPIFFFVSKLTPRNSSSESKEDLFHICSWKLWNQPVFSSSMSGPWPVVCPLPSRRSDPASVGDP